MDNIHTHLNLPAGKIIDQYWHLLSTSDKKQTHIIAMRAFIKHLREDANKIDAAQKDQA